ncbi:DUF6313 family protein [Microbispora bryophytorum]|uniref:DUF6313 family protein n=1 Tax=Microbispora bryophytorum TaxID=1460882 RepID=UPI00371F57C8
MIPHLRDLCFAHPEFNVPEGFAVAFVRLHRNDWEEAEKHWEFFVSRVLNSTAVPPRAEAAIAMRLAVTGAAYILSDTQQLGAPCYECARRRP